MAESGARSLDPRASLTTCGTWMPGLGIAEAKEAGADLDHIRSATTHAQASITARYIRSAVGKSWKVAELRIRHRTAKNGS